jgi:regulator of RNase E activity RraA
MSPTPDILKRLAEHDSCTICNVIELCNHCPRNTGYLSASIRAIYPELPPMVGYAVTAVFRSATQIAPGEKAHNLIEQIASWQAVPEPRVLVIQDIDDPPDGAVYGEVVATTAKAFGCVGLVTNGYARDLLQVRSLAFPCFAGGVCVSHSYCRIVAVGVPVTIGGAIVRPGDLLHGDANGVTTIPLELAERVADGCAELVANENILINAAREPGITLERYRELVRSFAEKQDALSRRLCGRDTDRRLGV